MKRSRNKFLATLLLASTFLLLSCSKALIKSNNKKERIPKRDSYIVDSVMTESFLFLYSLLNIQSESTINQGKILAKSDSVVLQMEKLTGINGTYPAGRLGRMFIYEEDYISWTNWYFKNRKKLIWDSDLKKLQLKE